jgi:hypothetical protein
MTACRRAAAASCLLPCWLTLLAVGMYGPANGQPSGTDQVKDQHGVSLPGTEYDLVLGTRHFLPLAGPSEQALLAASGFRANSIFQIFKSIPVLSSYLPQKSYLCVFRAYSQTQVRKLRRTIKARLVSTTRWPYIKTRPEPFIYPKAGLAVRRQSYPCSSMRSCITFKMYSGSNTSACRSVRSLPISLRIAGSLNLDILSRAPFTSMRFPCW